MSSGFALHGSRAAGPSRPPAKAFYERLPPLPERARVERPLDRLDERDDPPRALPEDRDDPPRALPEDRERGDPLDFDDPLDFALDDPLDFDDPLDRDRDDPLDRPRVLPARERDEADDRDRVLRLRRVPPFRSAAGISSRATPLVSVAICVARNFAMRSSSRRMSRASLAVSLSPTVSASVSIAW
jgi:hypothetical protein